MISLAIPQQQSAEHKRPRLGYLAIRRETTMSEEHAIVSIDGNHMTSIQSITTVWIRQPAAPLRFASGWALLIF
jgi:hypothetical protein